MIEMVVKVAKKAAEAEPQRQPGRIDVESRALDKLHGLLKDVEYLTLDRSAGRFEKAHVTRDFLRAVVKYPYIGFTVDDDVDRCLYVMTQATLTKFLNKLRDNKPQGSTTERTALVFDIIDRYETGIKANQRLLENNKFNKEFVDSAAFKDMWNDIISVSQVLTMSSLKDMMAFMRENGDLDEQAVKSGLLRRM